MYEGTEDGTLFALDAATGDVLWSYLVMPSGSSDWMFSSPVVADGRLYYVGRTLYAFGLPEQPRSGS